MNEVWLVEVGDNPCVLQQENEGDILFQINSRCRPTAFTTKQAAQRAIHRSLAYSKKYGYSWDGFRVVRFSRG
jgi:hypothetical protein